MDRRIRWHYTTTILRLRIGARLTRYRNCKFHNFASTISRHADGISRYSVPPSAGPLLPLMMRWHLQRAEMRMVRWMCGVKLKDRFPSKELKERLGVDDIALVLQQNRLRWYGHVLQKDDDDWVKKCMEYEVEGSRPRGRPKKTWKEVVCEDCQARKLNKEDAMDRCKWRKVIKEAR